MERRGRRRGAGEIKPRGVTRVTPNFVTNGKPGTNSLR